MSFCSEKGKSQSMNILLPNPGMPFTRNLAFILSFHLRDIFLLRLRMPHQCNQQSAKCNVMKAVKRWNLFFPNLFRSLCHSRVLGNWQVAKQNSQPILNFLETGRRNPSLWLLFPFDWSYDKIAQWYQTASGFTLIKLTSVRKIRTWSTGVRTKH